MIYFEHVVNVDFQFRHSLVVGLYFSSVKNSMAIDSCNM